MKISSLIIGLVFGIFLGFIFAKLTDSEQKIAETVTEIKCDTITIIKPSAPVTIEKVKVNVRYIRDTVIKTMPFLAAIDTVILCDTISASFVFPENLISVAIRKCPDTSRLQTVTIMKEIYKSDEKKWWEAPAYILGGAFVGFLLGSAR